MSFSNDKKMACYREQAGLQQVILSLYRLKDRGLSIVTAQADCFSCLSHLSNEHEPEHPSLEIQFDCVALNMSDPSLAWSSGASM